jgi:hypothetical protein
MGMTTRLALWLVFAAGVVLAASGLLPWYEFNEARLHISGLQAHTVSSIGDGYILLVLGTLCAALAAWQIVIGRLNGLALIGIAVMSSVALGIAITDLFNPGNVCGSAYFTDQSSHLSCIRGSGDVFFVAGEGYVTGFVWLALGLSLFVGLMAIALPLIEDYLYEDVSDAVDDRPRSNLGVTTQTVLRMIIWLTAVLAMLAFVPWLDAHTLNVSADGPRSMTAFGDAVLFACVALAGAFLASQMARDPSELLWGALVVAGGVLFVFAGAEITESTQGCTSNGTVLGFMNGFGCLREGGYALSAGQIVLWVLLSLSALVAILALGLPIIETFSRDATNGEGHDEWA